MDHGAHDPLLAELASERRLIASYDATIARHPRLRGRLTGLRTDHVEHAVALATALGLPAPDAGTTASGGMPDPGPTGGTAPGATGGAAGSAGTGGAGRGAGAPGVPGTSGTSGVPGVPGVPGTPAAAVAALRAAERAAASARGTAALTATADRAALLAGISASEATHLVVLA